MAILVFETSTERGIVALYEGSQCLYMAGLPIGYHNSRFLLPKIHEGLDCYGLQVEDLEGISVGIGPGSYTGIRVGAIAAKTMSWAKKIPLVGICTLKTLLPPENGPFLSMIDAKISGAYVIQGNLIDGVPQWQSEPLVVKLQDLDPYMEGKNYLVTPFSKRLESLIKSPVPFYDTSPDPEYMAKLAAESIKKGDYTVDGSLKLLYLRSVYTGG